MNNPEEIAEHNKLWYLKVYESLMSRALLRGLDKTKLDYYTELHHIIPRCLWPEGKNRKSNQCLLTAREHIIAHMLLARIYPDNVKLAIAVTAMLIGKNNLNEDRNSAVKTFSTRLIAQFREAATKLKIGQKRTDEQKERMSKSAKIRAEKYQLGKSLPDSTKRKMRESKLKNLEKEDSNTRKEKYGWAKGNKQSKEWVEKRVSQLKGRKGHKDTKETLEKKRQSTINRLKNNPGKYGMIIKDPEGRVFYSRAECARFYKVSSETVKRWIENHPEKGFKLL